MEREIKMLHNQRDSDSNYFRYKGRRRGVFKRCHSAKKMFASFGRLGVYKGFYSSEADVTNEEVTELVNFTPQEIKSQASKRNRRGNGNHG